MTAPKPHPLDKAVSDLERTVRAMFRMRHLDCEAVRCSRVRSAKQAIAALRVLRAARAYGDPGDAVAWLTGLPSDIRENVDGISEESGDSRAAVILELLRSGIRAQRAFMAGNVAPGVEYIATGRKAQ